MCRASVRIVRSGQCDVEPGVGRALSMNRVARPSRLRVAAASRRQHKHRARRPVNSQARTPALHPPGSSWSQCMCKSEKGLSMNRSFVLVVVLVLLLDTMAWFRGFSSWSQCTVVRARRHSINQRAAGILPAEGSEKSPADETSAAPSWWHCRRTPGFGVRRQSAATTALWVSFELIWERPAPRYCRIMQSGVALRFPSSLPKKPCARHPKPPNKPVKEPGCRLCG